MIRIDAHHHVWDLSVRDQPWLRHPSIASVVAGMGTVQQVTENAALLAEPISGAARGSIAGA
jgi:predicted TIM-barrel fold metal-dependent hydrolase